MAADAVGRYAFAIDHRRCIGCHACTVACKQEHGVELGVFRTWVKYIEQGTFPDARRYFSVLRCNHCDDAPCVEICPVTALYKRDDGIVDFDPEQCIGCKACLNACPYDALYIDPGSHTAAKCNFCAHRVDSGLKPSCEVVCPTQAILSGDLADPDSEISRLVATEEVEVRAPEQGTNPQVFYVGAHEASLKPLQVSGGEAYLTTEVDAWQQERLAPLAEEASATVMADVPHPAPWGWQVSSYFLSKGVAGGAMMLAPVLPLVGAEESPLGDVAPGALALAGIAVTGALLVSDLERPERFHRLLTRPQWGSWLAIGAQIINLAAVLALVFTAAALLGAEGVRDVVRWSLLPAGLMLASYTAFLFNQCEGRDLWQSRLLLPHTAVNGLTAGAAGLALAALVLEASAETARTLTWTVMAGAVCGGAIAVVDLAHHSTDQARRAALNLRRDMYALRFWLGGIALGVAAPVALGSAFLLADNSFLLAAAAIAALAGMWLYSDAWVRAGQSVPLS